MNRRLLIAVCFLSFGVTCFEPNMSTAQEVTHPGLKPFIPTRIDWLSTTLQASLRQDLTLENGFTLGITTPDPGTILIYVRYLPTVNREAMNITIDSVREVIGIVVKSYGWEKWLRIKEDVKLGGKRGQ